MRYLNSDAPKINYQNIVNNKYFVDKSLFIEKISENIGTGTHYICITRPRRFGKTINANMLAAYYTKGYDSRVIFDNLKIADTEFYGKHQNMHNVVYMDFSRRPFFCKSYYEYMMFIIKEMKYELEAVYPVLKERDYTQLSDMFEATRDSFIFILDEWDSIFYQDFVTEKDRHEHMNWLKWLLKDQSYVKLAYMTGVLPIAKYSSGSELNMFSEYNFMNDNVFDRYFGFDENEVQALCSLQSKVNMEELKEWYDGYYFSNGDSLFNPRSVNEALRRGSCDNFWTETGPMNEIAECVEHNIEAVREDIVKMVSGIPIQVELDGYSAAELKLNSRDEILSAMVVYGFLAYYDDMLSIPNTELMEKFQQVLMRDSMGEVKKIVTCSKEILNATLECNEEKVAELLEKVHDNEIPFLQYNDENSLSCVITLCYLAARDKYSIEREQKTGKGYCDYIFIPRKTGIPAIIMELKYGKSCEEAISQIKEKNYIQKVEMQGEILLVGINYDEKKHHTCRIEKAFSIKR